MGGYEAWGEVSEEEAGRAMGAGGHIALIAGLMVASLGVLLGLHALAGTAEVNTAYCLGGVVLGALLAARFGDPQGATIQGLARACLAYAGPDALRWRTGVVAVLLVLALGVPWAKGIPPWAWFAKEPVGMGVHVVLAMPVLVALVATLVRNLLMLRALRQGPVAPEG